MPDIEQLRTLYEHVVELDERAMNGGFYSPSVWQCRRAATQLYHTALDPWGACLCGWCADAG